MLKNFHKKYYPFRSESEVKGFLSYSKNEVLCLLNTRKRGLNSYVNRNPKVGYMHELEKIDEILAKLQNGQVLSVDEANFILEVNKRNTLKNIVFFVILAILLVLLVATVLGWTWIFATL